MTDSLQWPTGSIIATISTAAPAGWLLCDGKKIDAKYQDLIMICGDYTPNLTGRTLVGAGPNIQINKNDPDNNDANFPSTANFELKTSDGEYRHTLTEKEMPAHDHSFKNIGIWGKQKAKVNSDTTHTPVAQEGETKIEMNKTGGNDPHYNMQPYYVTNFIIYAG
ncbi:MAG: tail fiber protein [Pseudomonadota bacterium]